MEQELNNEHFEDFETITISRISWPAILAGAVIALAVQLLLNILGLAFGAGTLPLSAAAGGFAALGWGSALWLLLSTLIALFFGGWVSARMAETTRRSESALHGAVTWALATLVMAYLVTGAYAGLLPGTGNMFGRGMAAVAGGASSLAMNDWEQTLPDSRYPEDNGSVRGRFGQEPGQATEPPAAGEVQRAALWLFAAMVLGLIAAALGGTTGTPPERLPL